MGMRERKRLRVKILAHAESKRENVRDWEREIEMESWKEREGYREVERKRGV